MIPSIYDSSEVTVRSQWGHYNSATWPVPHRIFHDAQSIQLLGHPHDLGKLPKWQLWILMDGYSPKYMPIISWNGYEAMSYGWFIHVYSMLFPKDMPKIWKFTTGWWFQPLWKIWVSCDYDIPNIWKVIIQPCSSHHQAEEVLTHPQLDVPFPSLPRTCSVPGRRCGAHQRMEGGHRLRERHRTDGLEAIFDP